MAINSDVVLYLHIIHYNSRSCGLYVLVQDIAIDVTRKTTYSHKMSLINRKSEQLKKLLDTPPLKILLNDSKLFCKPN